jgi:hypothetical protein
MPDFHPELRCSDVPRIKQDDLLVQAGTAPLGGDEGVFALGIDNQGASDMRQQIGND